MQAARRALRKATICLVLLATCSPVQARKWQVEISNETLYPIYRITAWASDFLPNAFNLLSTELRPGDKRMIEINDIYDKCLFEIVADFRKPRRQMSLRDLRRRVPEHFWFSEIRVCRQPPETLRVIRKPFD